MNKNHARLILILSILLLVISGFDIFALNSRANKDNQVPQEPKPTLAQAVDKLGQVLSEKSSTATVSAKHLTIRITDPENGIETTESQALLRGSVSDSEATASAKINQTNLGKLEVATSSGVFSRQVDLELGNNLIAVTAIASNGAVAVATVSATLLKIATNFLPFYISIFALALIGALGLIWGIKKMQKPKSEAKTPWENTNPPKIV